VGLLFQQIPEHVALEFGNGDLEEHTRKSLDFHEQTLKDNSGEALKNRRVSENV
jgi:hypothetical protein